VSAALFASRSMVRDIVADELAAPVQEMRSATKTLDTRLRDYLEVTRYEREMADRLKAADREHHATLVRLAGVEATAVSNRELILRNQTAILERFHELDKRLERLTVAVEGRR
jgi:hypothetical protein